MEFCEKTGHVAGLKQIKGRILCEPRFSVYLKMFPDLKAVASIYQLRTFFFKTCSDFLL